MNKKELLDKYIGLADSYQVQYAREEKTLFLLSMLRLAVFITGVGLSGYLFTFSTIAGVIGLFIFVSFFIVLIKKYSIHEDKRDLYENLLHINQNEVKALGYDLSPFKDGNQWIDIQHDFSNDLDLFGKGSIFQYLNRTVTGYGNKLLSNWLSDPFVLSGKIVERQHAIREISLKLSWRQDFTARGMGKSLEEDDIYSLLLWLKDEKNFIQSILLKLIIFLLPSLAMVSLALLIAGIMPSSIFTSLFILNLALVGSRIRTIGKIHENLSKKYQFLSSLGSLLTSIEKEHFESAVLKKIKLEIEGTSDLPVWSLKKLSRIIQAFDNRMNILVGFFLNGLLLWDFHCVYKLEKWKLRWKDNLPLWLNHLGEMDAFVSLGNYAYNNQHFVYPIVSTDKSVLKAKNLGHPLLPEENRVCNDFVLDKSGSICIITGANMAGKSTFLRTVAANYILGMIGAPVCSDEMEFTPLRLFTSMRTTDSMSHRESYFYAELKRLKILKEKLEESTQFLFILDEILKGTNSTDKSNGSKMFLRKLIGLGGTGLIATHDTTLGELEMEFPDSITNSCFEIEMEGENIMFDYKLHRGITQKMNASLLLRQMGLTE